jgi:predicted lipoprotein with Yx(FWY)xxD motif
MLRTTLLAIPLALCFGCGDDDASSDPEPVPEKPVSAARASTDAGTKIVLRESDYGRMLFNSDRQAIYLFDKETTKKPRCYGDCAAAWPPVYANGRPRLGKGLDSNLLGTVKRRNGRKQITYGDHALYYYAHEGPGQVLCHDIEEFGGTWLVVRKSGKPAPSDA